MLRGFLLLCLLLAPVSPCFADAIDELNAAVKALERGQPERARDLVKVVINDVHTSNEYKAMAYYLYSLAEKNPQEAITYCAKAAELAPDNGRYHEKLGILYFQAQQYENAVKSLDKAIAVTPINAGAYSLRGLAYRESGQMEKALADMDKAISLDPSVPVVYARRGAARFLAHQPDGAFEDLSKAVQSEALPRETRANCYFYLAKIHMERRQYDKAKELLAASLRHLAQADKKREANLLLDQIKASEKWS